MSIKKETILIITALGKELNALLEVLSNPLTVNRPTTIDGRTYYVFNLSEAIQIVCTSLYGMGSVNSALGYVAMFNHWHPSQVFLAGICAGISGKSKIGDIIISDQIIDYESAKIAENKVIRWNVFRSDYVLNKELQAFNSDRWLKLLKSKHPDKKLVPNIISGAILSGNKVIANKEEADCLSSFWDKSYAIEMESSGITHAIHQSPIKPAFITVKCVCDLADSNKNDDWQEYSATASASYVLDFILSKNMSGIEQLINNSPPNMYENNYRSNLLDIIRLSYNLSELNVLAFRINVDLEDIAGNMKQEKIAELIKYCERKNKLEELKAQINKDNNNALATNDRFQ